MKTSSIKELAIFGHQTAEMWAVQDRLMFGRLGLNH
jgi:hypothetical protein